MNQHCGEQTATRRRWLLLGLLLVAAFLGHDLLMAAEATAKPAHADAAHHAHGSPGPGAAIATLQLHGTPSDHPATCRVGQTAAPRSGDAFGKVDPDLASAPTTVAIIAPDTHAGTFRWEEPRWPPGTLRALFQVYRI